MLDGTTEAERGLIEELIVRSNTAIQG